MDLYQVEENDLSEQISTQKKKSQFENKNIIVWKKNEDSKCCSLCFSEFTFFKRISHCRLCGSSVCSDCYLLSYVKKLDGNYKVCKKCKKQENI